MDNNPFLEIYRGVTRLHNDGQPEGGWNPTQKLSLYEVLRSYTYGSAYGAFRENELGTLEEGKFADIAVIDKDLFAIDPSELIDRKVIMTVMDGNIITANGTAYLEFAKEVLLALEAASDKMITQWYSFYKLGYYYVPVPDAMT